MPARPSKQRATPPARRPSRPQLPDRARLAAETTSAAGASLTTNQGVAVNDDQNSLKVGERGPSLLEDFHLREKITHFDHERIPERVVHARGSGAHGFFQVYESLERYTRASFLADPARRTPVFVRFSTVAGSRGSTDLARDVRGFAVKFYTDEGNFDLVGNNMPVFFIQDAIKFPDLIHAVKPEPHREIPQAASAHDTFWDFISLMPESMHMIMWVMSDRALPRSFRMMEGFGVHTFRLVDARGTSRFVKFHWKPLLGLHSVVWDEAQKISGKDPDFHRRDLWDAIDAGQFPEWELGLQIVEEADEFSFGFDLLDPTKLIPEELVPVQRVGKLTLDRNPDNFFAETEQVAFHTGNIVPGIDFSNDPLLQGRLFSYTDTQLLRLGGPNFHEIPINRAVSPVSNNQRDGFHRREINAGRVSYEPNSLGNNDPHQVRQAEGGFVSYPQAEQGTKVRTRSESFLDFYSQARMFFASQSAPEQDHIIQALCFELGKVEQPAIRERMVGHLAQIDPILAKSVAAGLGLRLPKGTGAPSNLSVPADADPSTYQHREVADPAFVSPSLSMAKDVPGAIATQKVAILVQEGFDHRGVGRVMKALAQGGALGQLVAPRMGAVSDDDRVAHDAPFSILTTSSVLFDGVVVAAGPHADEWALEADAVDFIREAFRHCKVVAASGEGRGLLAAAKVPVEAGTADDSTIVSQAADRSFANAIVEAMARGRYWAREVTLHVPPGRRR